MPEIRSRLPNAFAAIAPALLSLALLLPGTFDPLAPMESAPKPVWLLLIAAGCALAASLALLRKAPVPHLAAVTALALFVAISASLSVSEALLVYDGRRFAFALFAAVLAPLAAAWALLTLRRAPILFLASLAIFEALTGVALRGVRLGPPEILRAAMVLAPGWGASSLASLERRSLLRPWTIARYPAELHLFEETIARETQRNVFDVPWESWEDDAHLIHGWLLLKLAAAPGSSPENSLALLKQAGRERLRFADDPLASPEPFTAQGILYLDALRMTDGLKANDALRVRIATAWSAIELFSSRANDAALEAQGIATLRGLFDENHLDRLDPLFLETFSLEARRKIEAGDAAGYLALFDGLAADKTWPEKLRKKFAERSEFLRAHPEDAYEPAFLYLRAQDAMNRESDPSPFLDELRRRFPDSPLAREPAASLAPGP